MKKHSHPGGDGRLDQSGGSMVGPQTQSQSSISRFGLDVDRGWEKAQVFDWSNGKCQASGG